MGHLTSLNQKAALHFAGLYFPGSQTITSSRRSYVLFEIPKSDWPKANRPDLIKVFSVFI